MPASVHAQHAAGLKRANARIVAALEHRDAAIREAAAHGMSTPEIAEAVGLTRQRVWQIVRGGEAA